MHDKKGERVTGKKDRREQFIPQKPAHMDPIVRGNIDRYLDLIEEVACDPQVYGTDAPDKEEAAKRILQSLGTDWKASEEAIVDRMRAEFRERWRDVPEPKRRLLAVLYQRAAVRRPGQRSTDSSRKPSRDDCLTVAKPLLAHIPESGPWDSEWQYEAVSTTLADLMLPPIGIPSRPKLREYIKRSRSIPVYFDSLMRICEELDLSGEDIPPMLARWRTEVAGGRRRRPGRKPLPPYRPVKLDNVRRDLKIQLTIAVLEKLGLPPRGSPYSGCSVVAEALKCSEDIETLSEESVKGIWKERIWEQPFQRVMEKYSKAIAERTGLSELHTTEA